MFYLDNSKAYWNPFSKNPYVDVTIATPRSSFYWKSDKRGTRKVYEALSWMLMKQEEHSYYQRRVHV